MAFFPQPTSAVDSDSQRRGKAIVRYVLWSSLFLGVLVLRAVLGPKHLAFDSQAALTIHPAKYGLLVVTALGALAVRFLWLPRQLHHSGKTLVAMIVGCALSEHLTFYGLFLMPPVTDLAVGASLLLLLSFCPVFTPAE